MAEECVRRLAGGAAFLTLLALGNPGHAAPPPEKGMALGLFSADPHYRYKQLLTEIRGTGATHVSITWVWWQETIRSSEINEVSGWSATDSQVREALTEAKRLGFHVTAFPIIRLRVSKPDEWRGKIKPKDLDAWWESYGAYIERTARQAKATGADRLSVGSELLSMEHDRARFTRLIERVRMIAPDLELMYSANWDHFTPVSFWDQLDVVGLTGYWELTRDPDASVDDLLLSWENVKPSVQTFSKRVGKPVVITEIGYPSLDCGACWPWDETRDAKIDQEEQRRAYAAFIRAWSSTPWLRGVFFWNWFGFGGPEDKNYTPRNKPAADEIRRWYVSDPGRASR